MKRFIGRFVLLMALVCCLGASTCYVSGGYVGYGYTQDYYGDVFYRAPIDRYDYGFYGHP